MVYLNIKILITNQNSEFSFNRSPECDGSISDSLFSLYFFTFFPGINNFECYNNPQYSCVSRFTIFYRILHFQCNRKIS